MIRTKRHTKYLATAGFFAVLVMSIMTCAVVLHPFASAAFLGDRSPEYTYFYNQWAGGRGWHNVLPNGGIPNSSDKGTFISFITDKYYNGSEQEKTGAAFIINLQLGNSGSGSNRGLAASDINYWATLINQPQVSLSMEFYSFSYNSAYDTPTDDDLFYAAGGTQLSLVVRYNGVIVSVIKQDCGNPLDGNPGIPAHTPSWNAHADAQGPPSAYPGQTVTFNYNIHNDGPDPAPIVQYGTRYELYNGSTSAGWANTPGPGDASETVPPGGDITTHRNWSFTIPFNYPGTKICSWISYIPTSSSNGNWNESNHFCVTVNQPVGSCSAFNLIPGSIEPGAQYNTYASVTYGVQPAAASAYGSGGRLFVHITGPSGYVADATIDGGPPGAADISGISPLFPAATAGTYTVAYGMRGGAIGNVNCSASFTVAYHPYFSAMGGDVSAGNGFNWGGACTGNDNASIKSWNLIDNVANNYGGGNSGLGAFVTAANGLQHFVSGSSLTGGAASVTGHGLSFANYSGSYVAAPNFGTSIGPSSSLPCVHDYQADETSPSPIGGTTLASATLSGLAAGNYQASGSTLTIGDGAPIVLSGGRKVTIYVNGDVYIKNNITYSYSQISDIPMLRIVVKGGIYVDSNVTEIHGVFIAQAKAATGAAHAQGGIFATCATGPGATTTQYAVCNHKLTVVGAVAAENQVILGRSYGSLVAEPAHSVPADSAETFQYSPELWLNPTNGPTQGALTYQAFTSLPPVL